MKRLTFMHFKNRPSRSRGGFRRVNPYNGSFQRSRRNSYRRKAHSAFLTRLHICLRNLDILWPSLREAKPPVRFPVYAHLWEYRWVFPLRKRGPWPHQSLQIKNRLLKAVFFRLRFSFHRRPSSLYATSYNNLLPRLITSAPRLPDASPTRKTLATSCEGLAPTPPHDPATLQKTAGSGSRRSSRNDHVPLHRP